MNTTLLRKRISISRNGYGTYRIQISFRGQIYECYSHNTLAYDRIHSDVPDRATLYGYTLKGAYEAFYNACRRANGL